MVVTLTTNSLLGTSLDEVVHLAAQTGFEGLELACSTPHFGRMKAQRQFEQVGDMLSRAGLKLVALSVSTNLTDPLAVEEDVAFASEFIRVARRVGTPNLVITAGRPASLKATSDKWDACRKGLRALSEAADRRGVRLVLAVQRGTLADSLASVSRLLDQAGTESVGAALDLGHLVATGADVAAFVEFLLPRLVLARVQDVRPAEPDPEWLPLGEGEADCASFVELLRASGYDGPLCLPCRHLARDVDPQSHVEQEFMALQHLLRSGAPVPAAMDV